MTKVRMQNVVVFGNRSTFDLSDLQMLQLGDTNSRYRTYRTPD